MEKFGEVLVSKLGILLTSPEEEIVSQNTKAVDMYFLVQGDCFLNITENDRREYQAVKLLVEGQYFGEIGCLFGCMRTASVLNRNYNILARLTKERLDDLLTDFPNFKQQLIKHVFKYNYKKKKFLREVLQNSMLFKDMN